MHLSVDHPSASRVEVFLLNEDGGRREGPIGYVQEVCDGSDGHAPFIRQHDLTPLDRQVMLLPGWRPELRFKRLKIEGRMSPRDSWDA